jgi:endoglucanase
MIQTVRISTRVRRAIGAITVVLVGVTALTAADEQVDAAGPAMTGLHVAGSKLLNGANQEVRLLGVNRNSTEFVCRAAGLGDGFILGPTDDAAVEAKLAWGINAVRVPIAEDCWFDRRNVPDGQGGAAYRAALRRWVERLSAHGLAVVLDYHWAGSMPRDTRCKRKFVISCRASRFWTEVATDYAGMSNVVFDVYNEATTDRRASGGSEPFDWECWRDGGAACAADPIFIKKAVGLQSLIASIRATGARNPVLVGGVRYAGTFNRFLEYVPDDPIDQIIASLHVYHYNGGDTDCATTTCFDAEVAPVAAQYPVVIGEFGEEDCQTGFVEALMNWADAHGVGYLAWGWRVYEPQDAPECSDLSVISSYDGTPTNYGVAVREHLRRLAGL